MYDDLRIYLAGPMTGLPDNNRPAFNAMAERLRNSGLTIINPAEHDEDDDTVAWHEYLRRDISLMMAERVNALALLPGWENSGIIYLSDQS